MLGDGDCVELKVGHALLADHFEVDLVGLLVLAEGHGAAEYIGVVSAAKAPLRRQYEQKVTLGRFGTSQQRVGHRPLVATLGGRQFAYQFTNLLGIGL